MYYYRRCKECGYDESVRANIVFNGIKMLLLKTFHMVFRLTAKKKGMSIVELGAEVSVKQKTAWLFKRKVQTFIKAIRTTSSMQMLTKREKEVLELLAKGFTPE